MLYRVGDHLKINEMFPNCLDTLDRALKKTMRKWINAHDVSNAGPYNTYDCLSKRDHRSGALGSNWHWCHLFARSNPLRRECTVSFDRRIPRIDRNTFRHARTSCGIPRASYYWKYPLQMVRPSAYFPLWQKPSDHHIVVRLKRLMRIRKTSSYIDKHWIVLRLSSVRTI